jgi:hypothetical protein
VGKQAKTPGETTWLTMAQYAVRQGVSRTTVYGDWSLYGLIVRRADGMVNAEASDANLERDRKLSGRRMWRATRRTMREVAAADAAE